jgi:hypothetical protein
MLKEKTLPIVTSAEDGITIWEAPSAHVGSGMPTYEELKHRFPKYVNPSYRRGVMFTPVPERANTTILRPEEPLPFKYVRFKERMIDAERVATMWRHGLIPALPEEELDLLKEHPGELRPGRAIRALGAQLSDGRVLVAWYYAYGRELGLCHIVSGWAKDDLFLAVPMEAFQIAA